MKAWCSGRGGTCTAGGLGFESRRPRSHEIHAKNVGDGWGLAGGGLHRLKKFLFFGFFSVPTLLSVGHSTKALPSARQKTLGKDAFAGPFFCRVAFAECNTRQSLCQVQIGLCRVPLALGKATESGSEPAICCIPHFER